MGDRLRCPPRPCASCPYRADHPSGVWAESEYRKLAGYDPELPALGDQAVFHCHQENATGHETVCAGWLGVHGARVLAVRLALARGQLEPEDVDRAEATDVPLHASGTAAMEAGLVDIEHPGPHAQAMLLRLLERGAGAVFG